MALVRNLGVRWLIITALLAVCAGLGVAWIARYRAERVLAHDTLSDARLRTALLDSEIARFRLLPLALGDDRDVVGTLAGVPGSAIALNRKLEGLAHITGAAVIYLVGPSGRAVAASNWRTPVTFVGTDYRFRRYFRDALRLGQATQFARGAVSHKPGLFIARKTAAGGVVVVKLDFDRVEEDWARAGGDTFVRDANGIVLVSSRPAWRFNTTRPLAPDTLEAIKIEASVQTRSLNPLPFPPGDVSASVATSYPGWTLTLRRSVGSAQQAAGRIAGLGVGLAVIALAAILWELRQRRQRARHRTTELEEAVAARTAELSREIEERAVSEARAADLREGLRQANRLATLGQVTASVAHETAQPVAAIRAYAQNSTALLDRGDTAAVRDNLDTIARLTERISTVTRELREFARRRSGVLRPVLLAEVIDGALLILKEQLRAVTLDRLRLDQDISVMGGRVRLEQVLVNILQNALEALSGLPAPRITLSLAATESHAMLIVEDNGPGVAPEVAARLFTPFVTSRQDGLGLGLGLVIAHDIMIEMGGTLRHMPSPGGARFEIDMMRA